MGKLTALAVRNAKPGRHADGLGLYLVVKPSGSRSWLLRVQVDKRRRDIGLGSITDLTLAEAREKAAALRKVARQRRDPIAERDKDRRPVPTFAEAAKACHAELKSGWSARHVATFLSSLERHAFPAIGRRRVDQIESHDLRDMLAPIWSEIPDMARKVGQRATTVLNFAKSKGWRATEAPTRRVVVMGLARHGKAVNYAAMPHAELRGFVRDLMGKQTSVGRLALLFTIATAARSGEVRHARWSHIDLEGGLWNRPAELMKAKIAHSVTLNLFAQAMLTFAAEFRTKAEDAPVFPSSKGAPLSDMTLTKILRNAKLPYTVHGFRSTFRDWAAEEMPQIPDAVAEAALAHVVPDKVVAAYKRTNFIEMRRKLLDAWSGYIWNEASRGDGDLRVGDETGVAADAGGSC